MTVLVRIFSPRPAAKLRLVCLPHAGAGASAYATWPALLPASIEVLALQLPGREDRHRETPFSEWPALIEAAATALAPHQTLPFAFFGHSFGAVVAWELARWLSEREGRKPEHLFLSGRRWPGQPEAAPRALATLPEEELLAELDRRYGALSVASLRHPEVREIVLPTLRADVALLDKHQHRVATPLGCPVTAYAGRSDPSLTSADVEAWGVETSAGFRARMFDGGHFYLTERRKELVADVAESLAKLVG